MNFNDMVLVRIRYCYNDLDFIEMVCFQLLNYDITAVDVFLLMIFKSIYLL